MPSFVTHLESAIDGTRLAAGELQTLHEGRPLWVRYDLDQVKKSWSKDALASREPTLWRYRELLPHDTEEEIVSLGEGMTPLLSCPRMGDR
ncbi:MAG: threonine synthase, partial [Candidatus Hydrogenedentota bacterium]